MAVAPERRGSSSGESPPPYAPSGAEEKKRERTAEPHVRPLSELPPLPGLRPAQVQLLQTQQQQPNTAPQPGYEPPVANRNAPGPSANATRRTEDRTSQEGAREQRASGTGVNPRARTQYPPVRSEWSSGILDCFKDIEILACGLLCCWCQSRQTSAWIEGRPAGFFDFFIALIWAAFDFFTTFFCVCLDIYCTCENRLAIKRRYNIGDSPQLECSDFLAVCFCYLCANCQHARELRMRGDDVVDTAVVGARYAQRPGESRGATGGAYRNGAPAQQPAHNAQYVQQPPDQSAGMRR